MWSFVSSYKDSKELDGILKNYETIVDNYNKEEDSLNTVIWDLRDIVNANKVVITDLEIDQEDAERKVTIYRRKYSELLKQKPQTLEGKYDLEKEKVVVLLDENKSLDTALVLCDSVKSIQRVTINNLEDIIIHKDMVIGIKDDIIRIKNKEIALISKNAKTSKRKAWLKGAGVGVLVGIGVTLILSN